MTTLINNRLLIFSTILLAVLLSPAQSRAADKCERHPCVFLSPADIDILKTYIADSNSWEKPYFEMLKAVVDADRARKLDIPATGGGYTQRYICPVHGRYLQFDPDSPHEHLCSECGKKYSGEAYDAAWVEMRHMRNIDMARDAAIVYALTGDEIYAKWAADILTSYAKIYHKYPPHGGPAGLGRLTSQSLDEAVSLLSASTAYDIIHDSPSLSAADRTLIEKKFLSPAARHLESYPFGIHNIQVWQSTAMLAVSLLTGSSKTAARQQQVLSDQIEKGITPDGFWFESSIGYHVYATRPFAMLAAMCRNQGLEVCGNPKLQKMFGFLTKLSFPDGETLPSINDYRHDVRIAEILPGAIAARYAFDDKAQDPLIAALLGNLGRYQAYDRSVFLYHRRPAGGTPAWTPPARTEHMPATGLTILRRGRLYALVKYGPFSGGHDHNDRASIIFHDGSGELYPDRGTVPYGHPLYKTWYRTTEAHNTIMVDGQQSEKAACDADVFADAAEYSAVSILCNKLYPGVSIRRTVALVGDALIDVAYAESDSEHTYDWFLHANSEGDIGFSLMQKDLQPAGFEPPNAEMKLFGRMPEAREYKLVFGPKDLAVPANNTTFFTPLPNTFALGDATGFFPPSRMPLIMWRQKGKAAIFAAVTRYSKSSEPRIEFRDNNLAVTIGAGKFLSIDYKTGKLYEFGD